MAKLTVIVPIYNVEKYLEKCVMSIVNQTFKDLKIILVNDGSTDSSGEIADKLKNKFSNIIVIHKENGGLSDARNTGLQIVDTEYVTFVDSDDYIEPNMYEMLLSNFSDIDIDISIGSVWYEQENGQKHCPYIQGVSAKWNRNEALVYLLSFNKFNMSFCDKVFKTELFFSNAYGEEKLMFPIGKKCEDQYLMCKVLARARNVSYSSVPYYHYVQRFGSISRNKSVSLAPLEAAEYQLEFYNTWFPSISYVAESAYLFNCMSICSAFYKRSIKCPDDIFNKANKAKKKYINSVFKFKELSSKKKIQALLFCLSSRLYFKFIK